ncbi:hypothetical protein PHYBLDRAFT_39607 [Phycomyces blakesleeanus NRRL 1555(-)]|uniref:Uncharacterized protein n=1 Tax=Phycomyces blakesleeanus (strain ATCC 8743b / DSM 1359 / FGSC 10004 / NBRC 33097 / NRRL 1555) TaxID=763407 RepID=A0A162NGD8_PHYB8|nr:hypothetical protein PHYBLDRAFT_39607 [Phycomyces blakesleeanus NRRL 1555(-)]OAD69374.1 hypothetical protein PHYBLDRAFT_39607 [Phycomyces blakesleeanus NRRL 1555(-)]|eukprot:XP_018287414.1 hypothetical protein PHYBLDRAFT_39607 [Phycomyces blakesleeanus NRRL 1555(-)]
MPISQVMDTILVHPALMQTVGRSVTQVSKLQNDCLAVVLISSNPKHPPPPFFFQFSSRSNTHAINIKNYSHKVLYIYYFFEEKFSNLYSLDFFFFFFSPSLSCYPFFFLSPATYFVGYFFVQANQ